MTNCEGCQHITGTHCGMYDSEVEKVIYCNFLDNPLEDWINRVDRHFIEKK